MRWGGRWYCNFGDVTRSSVLQWSIAGSVMMNAMGPPLVLQLRRCYAVVGAAMEHRRLYDDEHDGGDRWCCNSGDVTWPPVLQWSIAGSVTMNGTLGRWYCNFGVVKRPAVLQWRIADSMVMNATGGQWCCNSGDLTWPLVLQSSPTVMLQAARLATATVASWPGTAARRSHSNAALQHARSVAASSPAFCCGCSPE